MSSVEDTPLNIENKGFDWSQVELGKLPGIGKTKGGRFEDHGIRTLFDLCTRSPQEIHSITGAEIEDIEKHCANARDKLVEMGLCRPINQTALELYKFWETVEIIKSQSNVDKLFGEREGIPLETLTEVYGEFGSGKTQYILTLCVETIKMGHNVIFVDCEGTFSPKRLIEIAISRGYYQNKQEAMVMLDKIITQTPTNSSDVMKIMENLTHDVIDHDVKLIVVDGSVGRFREEYGGRSELSDRQVALKPLMSMLGKIPSVLKCAVVFTNQVMSNAGQFFGDPTKPIGGNIVGHAAKYRMYFHKKGNKRVATMVDSPEHAKCDYLFFLNEEGVSDYETMDDKKKGKKGDLKTQEEKFEEVNKSLAQDSKMIDTSLLLD